MSRDILENISALLAEGKLADLREQLCDMNVVDIAQAMESLPEDELLRIFRILPKDISADVFSYLEPDSQAQLLNLITDTELENLLDDMFLDDTVDFLEEVPANVVRRVLAKADSETRCLINRFLKYPENSAGSIMTIEMVELHDFFTVGQAIEHIRSTAVDKETVYTCFCIDDKRHLIGTVALHTLLMAKDNELIRDIMDTDSQLICVNTLDDQEKVADIARKYDLLSVPVVDNEARLVGIITIDDIVDVIEDENTEDFEKMAMLHPSDDNYLKTGVFKLAKNRILWLLVLMVSATFTGKIIENYENMLACTRRDPPEGLSEDSVQRDKSRAHLRTDPRGSQHRQNDALLLRRDACLSCRFSRNGLRCYSGEDNRMHPADNRKDDKARPRAHGRTDDNDDSRYGHPAHLLRARQSVSRDIKNYPPYILVYGGFLCFVWRGLYAI